MTDSSLPKGPFTLSGPSDKLVAGQWPVRGDLAHIALAGRMFVPHYAVPQPRAVLPGGAPLRRAASDRADEICTLMEGDSFEVLDITGAWAWGCLSVGGPVGYVRADLLEAVV